MSCRRAVVVLLVVAVLAGSSPTARAAPPSDELVYQPPVESTPVDSFRPPPSRYGPGNRGLTYDLAPGSPVHASASGTVVFAGVVASTRHVTIQHGDGLRTSYSFLDTVLVRRGEAVRAGEVVGTAGLGFHFGARSGDVYVDPEDLFGEVRIRVRLVPHDEAGPITPESLRREFEVLRDLVRTEERGFADRVWGMATSVARAISDRVVTAGKVLVHLAQELPSHEVVFDIVDSVWRQYRQECTSGSPAEAVPAHDRTAVLVAGLGSSSESAAIHEVDTSRLGYADGAVLAFSYAGGRTPPDGEVDPSLAGLPTSRYGVADTLGDIRVQGRALADLVEELARRRPGHPIDLFAHSMGGLVTRVALLELESRGRLDILGAVVTIGTPHSGSDLATVGAAASPLLHSLADRARQVAGIELDPDATSVQQLAETSDLVAELRERGVPDGVDFRTVAARTDVIVTADKADVDGHLAAIVDVGGNAHDNLPGAESTTQELALALRRRPPSCRSLGSIVLDAIVPEAVSQVIDGLSLGLLLFDVRTVR